VKATFVCDLNDWYNIQLYRLCLHIPCIAH